MAFKEIALAELEVSPFTKFDKEWALVTAGTEGNANTMTVSWGGLGTLWSRPVATVYIRPQRYTKQFVDENDRFTVSFYAPEHKRALGVLGTKSGRDGDKVAEVGFTPVQVAGEPAFEEAELVLVCRKLYADEVRPENFVDASVDAEIYPKHDYHTLYIAEVEHAFVRA